MRAGVSPASGIGHHHLRHLCGCVVGVIGAGASGGEGARASVVLVLAIVHLGIITPAVTSQVTRLHDTGRPAWWLLISLVPFGGIVMLVFPCLEGQPHPNQWGPPTSVPAGHGHPQPYGQQQGYGQPPYGQEGSPARNAGRRVVGATPAAAGPP